MMELFPMKSVDYWMCSLGRFASIFTKISLLCSICYGVKFLHDNQIIHRDLKLANILIDKHMCPKITDFGEAYHPRISAEMAKRGIKMKAGKTLPYAPP